MNGVAGLTPLDALHMMDCLEFQIEVEKMMV